MRFPIAAPTFDPVAEVDGDDDEVGVCVLSLNGITRVMNSRMACAEGWRIDETARSKQRVGGSLLGAKWPKFATRQMPRK